MSSVLSSPRVTVAMCATSKKASGKINNWFII